MVLAFALNERNERIAGEGAAAVRNGARSVERGGANGEVTGAGVAQVAAVRQAFQRVPEAACECGWQVHGQSSP